MYKLLHFSGGIHPIKRNRILQLQKGWIHLKLRISTLEKDRSGSSWKGNNPMLLNILTSSWPEELSCKILNYYDMHAMHAQTRFLKDSIAKAKIRRIDYL